MGIGIMVALLSAATLQDISADSTLEIPFTLERDHLLVVRGTIGQLRDLRFVVDTGSGSTIINSSVTAMLGIKGPSSALSSFGTRIDADEVEIPLLELGGYRLERLRALSTPLDTAAKALGLDRLDGLIGIDALRHRSLAIDFRKRSLTIGATRTVPHRARLVPHSVFIVVRAEVDKRPLNLIVDTGSSHLVLFRGHDGSDNAPTHEGKDIGGVTPVRAVRVGELRIGKWTRRALVALVTPKSRDEPAAIDGLLSLRTLNAVLVQFDFEKQEIGWSHR